MTCAVPVSAALALLLPWAAVLSTSIALPADEVPAPALLLVVFEGGGVEGGAESTKVDSVLTSLLKLVKSTVASCGRGE
jgi:hypothetical protein